jgi:hypothetical protein
MAAIYAGSMRWIFALAGVVALSGACKGKPTDDRPDADLDQILREQARVQKGETVGEPLRAPKVVVGPADITVNGYRVTARSDLEPKLKRVDAVFDWAKGLREHWKQIHVGQSFDPRVDITLPEDLNLAAGASLVQTLAFAGFAPSITVHSGSASLTFDAFVPQAPSAAPTPPQTTMQACRPSAWQARGATPTVRRDPANPFGREERDFDYTPFQAISAATVASVATSVCKGACAALALEVDGATTFHDALPLLAAAVSSGTKKISFIPSCPSAITDTDAGASDAGGGVTIREGEETISGHMAPELVQRVLRANRGRAQSCYEAALAAKPKLHGRVVVKFTIGPDGKVGHAANAGSDLPDPSAVECVVHAVGDLSFPKPDSGTVTVVYPLTFAPRD